MGLSGVSVGEKERGDAGLWDRAWWRGDHLSVAAEWKVGGTGKEGQAGHTEKGRKKLKEFGMKGASWDGQ